MKNQDNIIHDPFQEEKTNTNAEALVNETFSKLGSKKSSFSSKNPLRILHTTNLIFIGMVACAIFFFIAAGVIFYLLTKRPGIYDNTSLLSDTPQVPPIRSKQKSPDGLLGLTGNGDEVPLVSRDDVNWDKPFDLRQCKGKAVNVQAGSDYKITKILIATNISGGYCHMNYWNTNYDPMINPNTEYSHFRCKLPVTQGSFIPDKVLILQYCKYIKSGVIEGRRM